MTGQTLTVALSHKWERGFDLNAGLSGNIRQFDTIDQFIFMLMFGLIMENIQYVRLKVLLHHADVPVCELRASERVQGLAPNHRSGTSHEETTLSARWISAGFYAD